MPVDNAPGLLPCPLRLVMIHAHHKGYEGCANLFITDGDQEYPVNMISAYQVPLWQKIIDNWSDRAPVSGWMPIESAPKDGRFILAACVNGEHDYMETICWHGDGSGGGRWQNGAHQYFPTHYMLLPAPPAIAETEGE